MKIKTAERKATYAHLLGEWGWQRWRAWVMLGAYTLFVVLVGAVLHRNGKLGEVYRSARGIPAAIEKNRLGKAAAPAMLSIQLESQGYGQLVLQRERAVTENPLALGSTDYIPATLRRSGETVAAAIRLKADLAAPLEGDLWCLRVRTEPGHSVLGMTQFSLYQSQATNHLDSWIYHQALRREGVPAPRNVFLRVTLNDADLGICALEEHLEHALPSLQDGRIEAVIQFDEDRVLEADIGGIADDASSIAAAADDSRTTERNRYAAREYHQAVSLLDRFRSGVIKTSEVFDVDRLAAWFAVNDLTGNLHDWAWHDLQVYYDPVTSRLVPIGLERAGWRHTERLSCMPERDRNGRFASEPLAGESYRRFFDDPVFLKVYLAKLEEVSQADYLEKLFRDIDSDLRQNLAIIYSEFPQFEFSTAVLDRNQEYIRSVLSPVRGLVAYLQQPLPDRLELQLGNPHYLPTVVLDAVCGDWTLQPAQPSLTLPGKAESTVIQYQPLSFLLPDGMEWKDEMLLQLRVRYLVLGTGRIHAASVVHWPYMSVAELDMDPTRKPANVHEFDFLVVDEQRKEISIQPGEWTIAKDLVIPAGYHVRCEGGVTLNLTADSIVLSYSPWELSGAEEAPVVIRSPDSTGQGVVIMNAKQRSSLSHVVFQNLAEPRRPGWSLTGAVTFYESPVVLSHCRFLDNRSEDSLNTVRGSFLITDCHFSHTQGDAFDADFCEGKIESSTFSNIGNDCIDVSGSTLEIAHVRCEQLGDKGLSIGEDSTAVARDVDVRSGRIGLAIKDLSRFEGQQITLSNCQYGVVTLRKKPEYGPASGNVQALKMQSVQVPYLIEVGTELYVDGTRIQPNAENLKEELYDI